MGIEDLKALNWDFAKPFAGNVLRFASLLRKSGNRGRKMRPLVRKRSESGFGYGRFCEVGVGLRGNCRGGGTRCRQRRQGATLPEGQGRPEGVRCRQGAKLGNSAGVAAYFGGIGGLISCRSCFVICELGKRNVRASNLGIWGYWESWGCHALRSWRCDSWGTMRNSVRRLRGYRRRLEEGFTHPLNSRFPGFDCV